MSAVMLSPVADRVEPGSAAAAVRAIFLGTAETAEAAEAVQAPQAVAVAAAWVTVQVTQVVLGWLRPGFILLIL